MDRDFSQFVSVLRDKYYFSGKGRVGTSDFFSLMSTKKRRSISRRQDVSLAHGDDPRFSEPLQESLRIDPRKAFSLISW